MASNSLTDLTTKATPCSPAVGTGSNHWFPQARYGLFVHWGPYAAVGRGEQVLIREHLDPRDYAERAKHWRPAAFDAGELADFAVACGMKYLVFTTRHLDGYCLWNSRLTRYSSACQAPGRDFVEEVSSACRDRGLRVGLYYSLADFRSPGYWAGPERDPEGWALFRAYVHGQVRELLTGYGRVDLMWFDGAWPHGAQRWGSAELLEMCRTLQPGIIVNNRLDTESQHPQAEQVGGSLTLGDFLTPEHNVVPSRDKWWESCQVSSWRLWGYAVGERYKSAAQILDLLCECASQGGNLLMNIGPDADGRLPDEPRRTLLEVGDWMKIHGEAIQGTQGGDVTEFVTYGYQTRRDNRLYLIFRFWPGVSEANVAGLDAPEASARCLTTGWEFAVRRSASGLVITGLPVSPPTPLFPVIALDCPRGWTVAGWARDRIWHGDPARMLPWTETAADLWPEFAVLPRPARSGNLVPAR